MIPPADEHLRAAIRGACAYVAGQQAPDQLWRDFNTLAGEGSEWISGFVASCLGNSGMLRDEVRGSIRGLIRRQRRSGGWGYNERVPPDCDSSAWVLIAMSTTTIWKPSFILQGLSYVLRHHHNDGFCTYSAHDGIDRYIGASPDEIAGWTSPHLCVTAVAVRALLIHGLARDPRVASTISTLLQHQQDDGLWTSYWWEGPYYATAQVLRSLAAARALEQATWERAALGLLACQSGSGCFGENDPFATAMALAALSTRPDTRCDEAMARAATWLIDSQRGGRWSSNAILRIPRPQRTDPEADPLRTDVLGAGVKAFDHSGVFTAAACISALADYRLSLQVRRARLGRRLIMRHTRCGCRRA
jgi:hypothetical protein